MLDYQWPHPIVSPSDLFITNSSEKENNKLTIEIENYFKGIFQTEVILVPSGRSGISILLKYFGLNRSHTVFAPKWTSHCVWDIVTRHSNPITNFSKDCDLAIAVHKWGVVEKFSIDVNSLIIEDSVDSIITSPETLFPNMGEVEIFSLPKIIGTYTGGLIVVKTKTMADDIRRSIISDNAVACYQSKLRFDSLTNSNTEFASWEHNEYKNTALDYNGLLSIKKNLANYELNKKCISSRLEVVLNRFNDIKITPHRLPPVIALEIEKNNIIKGNNLMKRNMNISKLLDKPEYKQVYLLPLHFGFDDKLFTEILDYFPRN